MVDKKLTKLLYFIAHDWPILPNHWICEGGSCSCGKADCKSPGKHPLTANGFYDATTNRTQVEEWHKRWPMANWGMRTGSKDEGGAGILVVDIDDKSDGYLTWDVLIDENQARIETVTTATGNGGQHLWFQYPEGYNIGSNAGSLGCGVDIRANGGQIIIPPSKTTKTYHFELNPDDTPIVALPDWILAMLKNGKVKKSTEQQVISEIIPQGNRHGALITVAGGMRRIGLDDATIEAALHALKETKFADGDHPVTDEEIADVVAWIGDKEAGYGFTDLGNAERFLRDHQADVRYCFAWDKWLLWDGKRWVIDDEAQLIRRAHETVRNIYTEASNAKEEERRKAIAAHAVRSEARSRIENMLHVSKPYLAVKPEELDQKPMLLNVKNGVLDLASGELLPHRREYLLTKYIDVEFNPKAVCPEWDRFLLLITGGDLDLVRFLQMASGYTLTGRTDEHCLLFLHGPGANGKTTFLETLRRMMREYALRIDIEAVMQNWNSGVTANPHVAAMAGARFVLASEIAENRKVNESLVKDLTGGDSITARFLFSNPFTFLPQHKLWIFGNYKPKVSGTDWGFWRRMRVIPFNVTIPDDIRKPMSEVLEAFEAEMPGILNWAVMGCIFWQNEGLPMPGAVTDATQEYRTEQDLLQQFLDEKCDLHPDYSFEKDRLYTAWRNWCEDNGEEQARKRSKKWLTRQLTARGFTHAGQGREDIQGLRMK